jgi:outer membrane protein OmpA-like peptidoglycan-associated protein
MKPLPPLLTDCLRTAAVLALLLPGLTSGAAGQVSVDMHALDGPGAAPTAAAHGRRAPEPRVTPAHRPTPTNTGQGTNRSPVAGGVAQDHATPKPAATAATGPAPALPTQQPALPPASTLVPAPVPAPGPLPPPVRLVFEAGKTDLTPEDEAAIQDLARAIPAPAADSVSVLAYAAGKPDDPSTARRLSLSRGLAVRSVLLASGVPSAQIYVRALGSTPSNGPADRVELTVAPIGTVTR